jgi:hypothetical protein
LWRVAARSGTTGTSLHVATACSGAEGTLLHIKRREAALSGQAGQGWYVPGRDGQGQTHGDRPCGWEKIVLRPWPGPLWTCSAVAPDKSRRRLASLIPPDGGFNPASRRRGSGACAGAQAHYRPGRPRPGAGKEDVDQLAPQRLTVDQPRMRQQRYRGEYRRGGSLLFSPRRLLRRILLRLLRRIQAQGPQ